MEHQKRFRQCIALRSLAERFPLIALTLTWQVFAFVVGFAVVFRSNQALQRYAEGRSALQQMHAKWMDAALEALTLDAASFGRACERAMPDLRTHTTHTQQLERAVLRLAAYQDAVVHGTSFMACAAMSYLRRDTRGAENLRCVDLDSGELLLAEPLPGAPSTVLIDNELAGADSSGPVADTPLAASEFALASPASACAPCVWPRQLFCGPYSVSATDDHNAARPLPLLGALSKDEAAALSEHVPDGVTYSRARMAAVWQARQCDTLGGLSAASPPIVSRIPQFLSDGNLGMANAKKIADVQFPYPNAVAVAVLLVLYTCLVPVLIESRTQSVWLAAVLSFLAAFAYWLLNEAARELEDPFVYAPNELPLQHMQCELNSRLLVARKAAWEQAKASLVACLGGSPGCEKQVDELFARVGGRRAGVPRRVLDAARASCAYAKRDALIPITTEVS